MTISIKVPLVTVDHKIVVIHLGTETHCQRRCAGNRVGNDTRRQLIRRGLNEEFIGLRRLQASAVSDPDIDRVSSLLLHCWSPLDNPALAVNTHPLRLIHQAVEKLLRIRIVPIDIVVVFTHGNGVGNRL